jgi:outer membrane lipoprotein-sorting protein
MRRFILVTTLLYGCALWAADLEGVLASMDEAAASFTGVRAKVEKTAFTAIINENDVERGEMWVLKVSGRSGGIRMRVEFTDPAPRSVAMAGRKAEIYYPKIKTVHEYDLNRLRDAVEQFLLLGFGTRGRDLRKDYTVRLAGEEEVGGMKAAKLELVPKDRKARERLPRAELWIAEPGGYPVQQKFYWPADDTHTISYSEVKINPGLSASDVTLELPADVVREHFPQ